MSVERRTTGDGGFVNATDATDLKNGHGPYGRHAGADGAPSGNGTPTRAIASGTGMPTRPFSPAFPVSSVSSVSPVPSVSSGDGASGGATGGDVNGLPARAAVPGNGGGPVGGGAAPAPVAITSAAAARHHARSVVQEYWGAPGRRVAEQAVIDLLLVVSELVTNAIRHGGGIAGFEVAPTPEGVRLSVRDHSDVVPAAAYGPGTLPLAHVGNGYGWPLIIRLARDIDVRRRPEGGKTISVFVPLV